MALGTGSEAACFGFVIRSLMLLVAGGTSDARVRVFFSIAGMKAFRLVAFSAFLVNGLSAQYTVTGQTTVAVELIRYLAVCRQSKVGTLVRTGKRRGGIGRGKTKGCNNSEGRYHNRAPDENRKRPGAR